MKKSFWLIIIVVLTKLAVGLDASGSQNTPDRPPAEMLTSAGAWMLMWLMCYWLYRKRILIKI